MNFENLMCPLRWARILRSLAHQLILGKVLLERIEFKGRCEPLEPYTISFTFRFMHQKAINTFRKTLE